MPIPKTMRAMVLEKSPGRLVLKEVPVPDPGPGELLLAVAACGACRTDLHIVDGELTEPKLPLIPGHQIVGKIVKKGSSVDRFQIGDRVGVPWLGQTCGVCRFCKSGRENLCDAPVFTGYTRDGGFAEYAIADQNYCFSLPESFDDLTAAPLLCAGLIGFRTLRLAGEDVDALGIYGFGAAAHIVTQIAVHRGKRVYAFTRPGDRTGQDFARGLGAVWAGAADQLPPEPLDAALIFAPAGELVPAALQAVAKGGQVVCGGIHMSDIPSFPYRLLWEERVVKSVANLTRRDGVELLKEAARVPVRVAANRFPLEKANRALDLLRRGAIEGAAVLVL